MKKGNNRKLLLFFALFIPLMFSLFSSCRRNKDCTVTITVQDGSTGGPVAGASVRVGPSKTNANGTLQIQDQTATTDGSGIVTFTFKLPAILEADVTPPSPYTCALPSACSGLVKLEEGKSVNKTLKIF